MLNRRDFALLAAASPLAALPGEPRTPRRPRTPWCSRPRSTTSSPSIPVRRTRSRRRSSLSNVYDRLVRYEAEDMTKLVGGVAESWTVSPRTPRPTPSSCARTRSSRAARRSPPMTWRSRCSASSSWTRRRPSCSPSSAGPRTTSRTSSRRSIPRTLQFKITDDFAPTLVLNLMATVAASVVEKKVAMANEMNGDLGNAWLKTHSATSGAYKLISWKANKSVTIEANPGYHLGPPKTKRVVVRHVPEPATAAPAAREGRHRHRAQPAAGPAQAAGRQQGRSRSSRSRTPAPGTSASTWPTSA